MNTQHAPGPWEARQAQTGMVSIYPVGGPFRVADAYDGLANARLIAAAPDMLEALIAIVALSNDQGRRNLPECAGLARQAIAKARGG